LNSLNSYLTLVLGLISVVTFIGGAIAWYSSSVRKDYAAQRDFGHLKNNYKQMAESLASVDRDLDDRFDRVDRQLIKIESKLDVVLNRPKD
jgi:hypothetical protein